MNDENALRDIKAILDDINSKLDEHSRVLRELDYKVDDLNSKFRRHEKAHEIFGEEDYEQYQETCPALGGIAGEVDPEGRFMRW